jgi:hypothetical protein
MTKNDDRKPPLLTRGMLLRSFLLGSLIGLPLFFLKAPLWAFYVAPPIPMAPWIFWELLHLESQEKTKRGRKAPKIHRPRDAPGSAT